MKPLHFDATTAREIVGDAQARSIEAKARADADAHVFAPPVAEAKTYWGQVQGQMREIVYAEQYAKRLARNARKAKT